MAKTDRLPIGHQRGSLARDPFEQGDIGVGCIQAFRRMVGDEEISQLAQRLMLAGMGEMLEMSKADEAGRDAGHNRRSFGSFAPDRQAGTGDAQGPCRGDAQGRKCLRAEEFADRRTQHRTAIAPARVGRTARAFELQFHRPGGGFDLAEQQRAAIAELTRPDTELVTAVDAGQRLAAGPGGIAA